MPPRLWKHVQIFCYMLRLILYESKGSGKFRHFPVKFRRISQYPIIFRSSKSSDLRLKEPCKKWCWASLNNLCFFLSIRFGHNYSSLRVSVLNPPLRRSSTRNRLSIATAWAQSKGYFISTMYKSLYV